MIEIEAGFPATNRPTFLLENLLLDATGVTVTGGGDAGLALEAGTYDYWAPTSATGQAVYAFSGDVTFNCLSIAAHDIGTQGGQIVVTADAMVVAVHTPTDDSAIMIFFPSVTADNVTIAFGNAPSPCKIGVMMLGEALTMQRGIASGYVPTEWAKRSEILGGSTISGQFLQQREIRTGGETSLQFAPIDASWWRQNGEPLRVRYNSGKPFFYAGGPSLFASDVAYCWRAPSSRELLPQLTLGGFVSVNFTVNFYA
jgi:hypothetical protein